jgi:CubicO group peptidase (beta-lactamase class C family)
MRAKAFDLVNKWKEGFVVKRTFGFWILIVGLIVAQLSVGNSAAAAESAEKEKKAPQWDHPRVKEIFSVLDFWLDAQVAFERFPGLSIGIVHDQELVWSRGFGYADRECKQPATPRTIYSICSISKLFTSIGIMQLRDQGKLRLDDPVSGYLPWFNIQKNDKESPPVTVGALLSHSAGLPREADFSYWTGPDFAFPTREEIIEQLPEQCMLYPADRYYQYSNLGITMAGEIIAQVSDMSYAEYIAENVLGPLQLYDTTSEMPKEQRGDRLATGYGALLRKGTRSEVPFFQAKGIAPAAGFASTVEDLAKFASWQFRLLAKGGEEVLKATTLREMHRVHWVDTDWKQESYRGLGFEVKRQGNKTFVGHGGSCPGYRTRLSLDPKEKIAVVLMVNAMGLDPGLYTLRAHQIASKALAIAKKPPSEEDKDKADLEIYEGVYQSAWGEAAVLRWQGELAMLYPQSGSPLESLVKLKREGDHRFRRVRKDGELGEEVHFELDESGRVERVRVHNNYMKKVE